MRLTNILLCRSFFLELEKKIFNIRMYLSEIPPYQQA